MTLFFDPSDPDLRRKVLSLQPTPGYCVFVDITASTKMKDEDLHRWAAKIHNAFANVRTFMPIGSFLLKSLGDGLLHFMPKQQLQDTSQVPLQLFAGLASVVGDPDPIFPEQKAAVVSGVGYELTFISDRPDVYGKDVDLAARLCSEATTREVLMNRAFYDEVLADYKGVGAGSGFDEVNRINRRDRSSPQGIR